jgi:phenylacetic acid degradation operon negative regulatory protein
MKAKTELFLYHLFWMFETITLPRLRNADLGFEGWAYRSGLLPAMHRLEAAGFLDKRGTEGGLDRFVRLTDAGRVKALGGRDPVAAWSERWDRNWHVVLFDIPKKESKLRRRVLRALAESGCGCLQGSVWIAPRRPACSDILTSDHGKGCATLLLLQARSEGAAVDRQMVHGAWDFKKINDLWQEHLEIFTRFPAKASSPGDVLEWSAMENARWLAAIRTDPLLPEPLLPRGYLGKQAWKKRETMLPKAAKTLKTLLPAHI